MRSISPKEGTPTAIVPCRKAEIDGTTFWLKGASPVRYDATKSPYNERAAYLLDRMLNLKMVPTTMLILVEGKVVSAQKWVKADRPKCYASAVLKLFDYIIDNTDRHSGNWLVGKRGKVWAIDNAYGFGTYVDSDREVVIYAKGITEIERARFIRRLELVLVDKQKLHKRFDCLIGKDATNAMTERMEQVLRVLAKIKGVSQSKSKEMPC